MDRPNEVADDSLRIAAEIFEIIHNDRDLPVDNLQWFLDHIYDEATQTGRALYDVQMSFRDRDDLTAPFETISAGEVIPVFTLLFSRRDDLFAEKMFDVSSWGVSIEQPDTWVKANAIVEQFKQGFRFDEWDRPILGPLDGVKPPAATTPPTPPPAKPTPPTPPPAKPTPPTPPPAKPTPPKPAAGSGSTLVASGIALAVASVGYAVYWLVSTPRRKRR